MYCAVPSRISSRTPPLARRAAHRGPHQRRGSRRVPVSHRHQDTGDAGLAVHRQPRQTAPANPVELRMPAGQHWTLCPPTTVANLDVAAGRYPGLKLAGWDSRQRPDGRPWQPCFHPEPGRRACLRGQAIEGATPRPAWPAPALSATNCFIDSQATINDSVILPGTYVGENIEIRNAIVNGNQVIRVDSGAKLPGRRSLPADPDAAPAQFPGRAARQPHGGRAVAGAVICHCGRLPPAAALLNAPTAPLRQGCACAATSIAR